MNLVIVVLGLVVVSGAGFIMARFFGLTRLSREPQLLSALFVSHVAMHVVPATLMLFDRSLVAAPNFFLATVLASALIPIGGVVANLVLPAESARIAWYFNSGVTYGPTDRVSWRLFLLSLAGAGALIALTYVLANPSFPLRAILFSLAETRELNLLRREARGNYIQSVSLWTLLPMLFVCAAICWQRERSLLVRLGLLACMGLAVFYNAYAGRKTPVALLFVLWFIALQILHCGAPRTPQQAKARRRRLLATSGVLALAILYPVFIFQFKAFGQTRSVLEILWEGVAHRILMTPATNTYVAFEMFPRHLHFTQLADTDSGAALAGVRVVDVSSQIALYKGLPAEANAPATTIGHFYLQWGWPAVIIGVLAMATFFQLVQSLFFRLSRRRTFLNVVFYTFCLWATFRSCMGYFQVVLLSEVFAPILLLTAWGWFVMRFIRIRPLTARPPAGPPIIGSA